MKNTILIILSLAMIGFTTSCKQAAGDKAAVSDAAEVKASTGTSLPVNLGASVVTWEGVKPTGSHVGTINLSSGEVTVDGNTITGGSFVLDMNSINNTDMEGDGKAPLLTPSMVTSR